MLNLVAGLLPLVAFYAAEARWGLQAGVAAAMALAVMDLAWRRWRTGRFDRVVLFSAVLVLGLGGLSLLSRDERFVLYSPVVGDAVLGGGLLVALALGASPLEAALREQDSDADVPPQLAAFLRGLTARLAVNLLLHGAVTAWAAQGTRETWLFASGPLQYLMLGAHVAAEVAWVRWVLWPRIDAEASRE